jgi:hypothetical protein
VRLFSWFPLAILLLGCSKEAPTAPLAGKAAAQASATDACAACRKASCSNYQGLFDLVSACFDNKDTAFVTECKAVLACANRHECGYQALGAAECFCGTADLGACATPGVANGPCQQEWLAAARSTNVKEVSLRFSDVSFPSGVANFLLQCDRESCPSCVP